MLNLSDTLLMKTDLKKDTSQPYNIASRAKIISLLIQHSEKVWKAGKEGMHFRQAMADQDIATLINELQEYHHLLEMQNDELKRMKSEMEITKLNQQKNILSAMFTAQEKERNRISQALHDSVCQLLYGIRLNLQSSSICKENSDHFNNLSHLLDQAINETRLISYELRPSILIDFGFSEGIKEMIARLTTPFFKIRARISPLANKLDPDVQLHFFRIIQELVNNVLKHANAKNVDILLGIQETTAVLEVRDDGEGFQEDVALACRNGSGLRGIKNQLVLLNGKMTIDNTDIGATIRVQFEDININR